MSKDELHYDNTHITFLEKLWGDGFMSPGGKQEIKKLLKGLNLKKQKILDIGCGSGGITVSLIDDYGAQKVIGVDVEKDVVKVARDRVSKNGLKDKIDILLIDKSSLPFNKDTFDMVFSKDSFVHIPDKERIFTQVFKVLKPGGVFVFSDWLISHDHKPSKEMEYYLKLEDLGFGMASPLVYSKALKKSGFVAIKKNNRNKWYKDEARRELEILSGPSRKSYEDITSKGFIENQINTWKAMIKVLDTGEHCPHHFSAQKPLNKF